MNSQGIARHESGGIAFRSASMRAAIDQAHLVAPTAASVPATEPSDGSCQLRGDSGNPD